MSGPRSLVVAATVVLGVVAGCTPPAAAPSPSVGRTALTVGLGYIPSVQFAQFYRAQQQGYYRDAGLDVTLQHQIDSQLIPQIGQGAVDIGLADGTSLIPAVGNGIPVRYAATIYADFPSVVIARAGTGIERAADLRGKRLGIPGRYGSSWVMLQALLASAGLTPDDLEIRLYSDFGQAVGLREGQVDAATGFANNEPVVLALAGIETVVLRVDDFAPLPGQGLTVGQGTMAARPDEIRALVAATLRAETEIIANPDAGLDDAIAVVPELGQDRVTQLAVLRATVEMWQSPYTDQHGLGAINRDAWTRSIDFMRTLPDITVPADLDADKLVTEDFLP